MQEVKHGTAAAPFLAHVRTHFKTVLSMPMQYENAAYVRTCLTEQTARGLNLQDFVFHVLKNCHVRAWVHGSMCPTGAFTPAHVQLD